MVRVVLENILLFLLPTAIYVTWVWLTRKDDQKGVLDEAPLLWLVIAGTAMVFVTLLFFGSNTGGRPDQKYVPPVLKDGKIEPGRLQ